MTGRRAARGRAAVTSTAGRLGSVDLLAGPCLETWAPGVTPQTAAAKVAMRAMRAAVQEWAASAGMTYWDARSLARCPTPWSREYLIRDGRGALADYYDGRRPTRPAD